MKDTVQQRSWFVVKSQNNFCRCADDALLLKRQKLRYSARKEMAGVK